MTEATETKTTTRKAATVKTKTLAEALIAFQANLPKLELDADNPHFKSKFSSLKEVTNKVFPALAENDMGYTTKSRVDETGRLIVVGKLFHTSGEFEEAEFPVNETNPQKIGSAITYARRYNLAALTGVVADVDDDGNAASAPAPKPLENARAKVAQKAPAAPNDDLKAKIRAWIGTDEDRRKQATEAQNKGQLAGLKGEDLQRFMLKELGA